MLPSPPASLAVLWLLTDADGSKPDPASFLVAMEKDRVLAAALPADSDIEEVVRNFFIRQPVLWVD
jgi:hypothetical protein